MIKSFHCGNRLPTPSKPCISRSWKKARKDPILVCVSCWTATRSLSELLFPLRGRYEQEKIACSENTFQESFGQKSGIPTCNPSATQRHLHPVRDRGHPDQVRIGALPDSRLRHVATAHLGYPG